MPTRSLLCASLAVATLSGATATATASAPPDGSEPAADDVHAPFWAEASAACTEVLNRHLDPPSAALDVVIGVIEAESESADENPSAETIVGWAVAVETEVARAEEIRAELAAVDIDSELDSDLDSDLDSAVTDLWSAVVGAADDRIDAQRARLTSLETGDWDQIVAAFGSTLGQTGTSDEAFAAIDASPLRGTDCAVVHSWRMPDDESVTAEFVTAVTGVCVDVANRRLASSFADDLETSLQFLATVFGAEPTDAVAVPAELAPALDRIVDEWELTVADLATIDPALAPSSESWAEVTAVPAERLTMFEARRDAVASGDTAAILEAYDRANLGDHPGWDWPLVGIEHRTCNSLRH